MKFVSELLIYLSRNRNITISILAIVLAVFMFLIGWFVGHASYKQLETDYELSYVTVQNLKHSYDELKAEHENLMNQYTGLETKLDEQASLPNVSGVLYQQMRAEEMKLQERQETLATLQAAYPAKRQQWEISQKQWILYEQEYDKRITELLNNRESLSLEFSSARTKAERDEIQAKMWDCGDKIESEKYARNVEIQQQIKLCAEMMRLCRDISDVAESIGMSTEDIASKYGGDTVAAATEAVYYYEMQETFLERTGFYQDWVYGYQSVF